MDDQNRNLILATALRVRVILIWFVVFPPPEPVREADRAADLAGELTVPPAPDALGAVPGDGLGLADAGQELPRVEIETPRVRGTINLRGGRLDDLSLKDYRETLAPDSDIVHLFTPEGTNEAFYALWGWRPGSGLDWELVPGPETPWTLARGERLAPGSPVTLAWENGVGLTFTRTFEVDANFMFTVTDAVANSGDTTVRLAPYGLVARHGEPSDLANFFILHEGMIKVADGNLTEDSYSRMRGFRVSEREGTHASVTEVRENGWIGFTDKYWMATLIPEPGQPFTAVARYVPARDVFQTRADLPTEVVGPGETVAVSSMLFAGAKEWTVIRDYEREKGIDRFIDAIDWGWFFFLTKPIFAVLYWVNGFIGNMGWSIIVLTLMIKLVLLPLAWKSYVSMAKMKELQPEMMAIKERAGEDKQKLQKEMIELYKTRKVNPAAGCLPILLQIPIFFALYKVIFVTIELRHAPWLGPFQDLSAPDPTSLFNLFGALPWDAPVPGSILSYIFIGILPIGLGVSMFFQMKLNPAPTDKMQATIFAWMPWVFMFILGVFASGLILYWIANNVITFAQQYFIMWRSGHRPDLFGNIVGGMRRKKDTPAK
jgi:YidC/Oxa1 family membrane protein insertase